MSLMLTSHQHRRHSNSDGLFATPVPKSSDAGLRRALPFNNRIQQNLGRLRQQHVEEVAQTAASKFAVLLKIWRTIGD